MARVAVVTGGAKRIGRTLVTHLHEIGFDIALHFRASSSAAEALADMLNGQREGSCELFQADFEQAAELQAMAEQILARYQSIDLLVNNASGFEATPVAECTPQQFDAMLASNLRGPYFLVQGILPALQAGGASIVNILDAHTQRPLPHYNVYGAAKAGLESLTRSLAVELAPDIRVNGIAPGAILWPEQEGAYDQATQDRTVAATPLQRLGEPLDIARAVEFLSCDAPFITGQVIVVDGGRSLVS